MSDTTQNALILTNLILQGLQRLQGVATLLNAARAEGRDVSNAELDALSAEDDAVNAALKAEIARQRGG